MKHLCRKERRQREVRRQLRMEHRAMWHGRDLKDWYKHPNDYEQ